MKLAPALLAASASALGINCRGNGLCPTDNSPGNLRNLMAVVDGIQPRDRAYRAGQPIACEGSLCAAYQRGAQGSAEAASRSLRALFDHGCHKCGSVPTQPGNDVERGELTVNVVPAPPCRGAC